MPTVLPPNPRRRSRAAGRQADYPAVLAAQLALAGLPAPVGVG